MNQEKKYLDNIKNFDRKQLAQIQTYYISKIAYNVQSINRSITFLYIALAAVGIGISLILFYD